MSPSGKSRRRLEAYRAKRDPDRTPEPFGGNTAWPPRLFVVQKHAARRLHYDFRLEWEGVLWSWAVPRGPSLDPGEKRLAVQVEDHPVEYADFEGIIPEGNYGAGAVILWDRGRWIPLEDPEAGLRGGKLLFDLEGYKLRGRFTLVRTGGRSRNAVGREWLLIKKRDAHARPGSEDASPLDEASILSGQTLEEMRDGSERAARARTRLARWKTPRRRVDPARVRPMLAERWDAPFSKPGWVFEVKYDGYRMIAAKQDETGHLYTRRGQEVSTTFPEICKALAALPYQSILVDGELVVVDREGRPRFHGIQERAQLRRARDVERASVEQPCTLFVFDLLGFEGFDLRPLPLSRRQSLLGGLLPPRGPLRVAPHFEARGEEVFQEIERLGLEGMVAKRADSPYRSGRSPAWRKIRILRTDDFVVVGFTAPKRSRSGFGALHLAARVGGELRYAGRVGSGFRDDELAGVRRLLEPLRRTTPPCGGDLPHGSEHRWVEPRLVCEVRYAEITRDGLLRQPVFLRLRDDKTPEECELASAPNPPLLEAETGAPLEEPREVPFTNLDKVFWPEEGLTKGDLVEYARTISPWLLPYLRDRPLVLTRYPDGIRGKSFFQKDAPRWVPSWIRVERMWSEHAEREIHYFVCDELESLLYVVNLGTIPLHVWSSRISDLQHPDWCILDLDPKGAPMAHVVRVARFLRALCEDAALPCFVKTSGSEGLHLLIPLGGRFTYAQSRTFAQLLARIASDALPEIATVARRLRSRRGRVYIDALQNGHGRLLVAPFSVRPLPGAPVSMPLRWSEVQSGLRIGRFHLRNAARRMRRLGDDPLHPVLDQRPDLLGALEALRRKVGD